MTKLFSNQMHRHLQKYNDDSDNNEIIFLIFFQSIIYYFYIKDKGLAGFFDNMEIS